MEKETFAESLRNHIYYLFVNLMTYANTNSLVFSVFLLAESLQLFSYPFNYHFYDESNSDTARYFSESTTYLRLLSMVNTPSSYFAFLAVILAIPYLAFLLGVFLLYLTFDKRSTGIIVNACVQQSYSIAGYLFVVLMRFLPLPFVMALLQAFTCQSPERNFAEEPVSMGFAADKCWSVGQIVIAAVGGVGILLYIALEVFALLFYSSMCYISPLPWADQHPQLSLILLTQKIVIACFLVFDPEMDKGSIALILLLCLSLLGFFVRYKNICWRRSYLSYLLSMYRDVTFFGLSLMVLLHYFLDISAYTPYMIPAVSILCVYALESILIYRAFLLNPVASPQELNSVTDGMVYIETILRNSALVGSGSETGTFRGDEAKEAERLLYSMLAAHHRTCEEVNCVCRDIDAVQVNVSNVDAEHRPRVVAKLVDEQGWKRFGKRQLNDLINKYPRNAALHIFLACVEHYDLKNKYKTLYNLRKAEEMRPSPSEHLDIMYIQTQVEGDMALKKNDLTFAGNRQQNWGSSGVQLSASRLYKFMQLYNSFMEEIEICTSSSVNFWTILLQETPDAEHLGVIGNSISTSLKRIHNIYMKAVRKNTASTNFLFKYCVFLRHIVYDDITADMVSSKLKTMKNKNAIQGKARAGTLDVKSDRLMLLRLSGDKGSLGKIIDVNFEFCLQMKYDKKDLVGTRLSKLLPQMVAECHDDWMLASYESQKFNRLDAITTGCLRDKRGYFHFLTTAIKEIPNLKEGLSFLAALQINERMAGYAKLQDARGTPCMFICDRGGKVVGVNEEVTKVFRLTPGNIERDTEMNIEKLFPMLSDCDTGRAARSKDGILVDVKLNQYKEMNIENEFVDQSPDDAANATRAGNQLPSTVGCRLKIVEEEYGKDTDIKRGASVVMAFTLRSRATPAKIHVDSIGESSAISGTAPIDRGRHGTGKVDDHEDSKEDRSEAEYAGGEDYSVSGSVTSSNTSHTSDTSAVREFKLSLVDLKYPKAVTLLKYTLWLLIVVLVVVCTIDWAMSFAKVAENKTQFSLVSYVSARLDMISRIAFYGRTKSLIVYGSEEEMFYGLDNFDITQSALVESIERLSYLEGLLEENINNLVVESLAVEQSEIEVYNQGVAGSSYTRKQTYSTAVQEYLVHALNVASYTSLSALQSLCAQDCDDFNRSAYYILVNGFTDLKDTSEKSVNVAYDLFSVSTGDDKNTLNIINGCAMGATLICYLIIIPRILSVVKQKSQVMQIFADISDDYIKEMLSSIGQISIQEVAYGKEMTFVRKPFKEAMSPGACGNANETLEKPDKDSVAVRDKLGPSDVTKQTDEALALTTQNNQVNAAAESKAQAARAKIQRKRESLKKSGYLCRVPSGRSEIKRKSIITISAIVIVIWMFFAGSIGITELIYKYYNDITKAWKSVGMRRPYLSLQVLTLRELCMQNIEFLQQEFSTYNTYFRDIVAEAQSFLLSGSAIMNSYKDLSRMMETDQFCDTIRSSVTDYMYNSCLEFSDGTMLKGMYSNVYRILSNLDSLMNTYNQRVDSGESTYSLMHDSKFDFITYVKTNFMDPAYNLQQNTYYYEAIDFYDNSRTWVSIKDGCFMAALVLAYVFILLRFLDRLKTEIWHTKGLLSLIPTSFILNNPELRLKFLSHQGI